MDDRKEVNELFKNMQASMPEFEELLAKCSGHWGSEDSVYRFYHQSFKVYNLQDLTLEIVERLQALAPDRPLNDWFMQIVREGTSKMYKQEDNENWLAVTRPIVEAFFHARYFLEMAVKYRRELESPPQLMPSGWAAVLYLYNMR